MRVILLLALLWGLAPPATPQTGVILDTAVSQAPLSVEAAIALVVSSAGIAAPNQATGFDENRLRELGYRVSFRTEAVTAGEFALLVAQAFDYRGGLKYELIQSPATAFDEFRQNGYFNGASAHRRPISGGEALDVLGRFVSDLNAGDDGRSGTAAGPDDA